MWSMSAEPHQTNFDVCEAENQTVNHCATTDNNNFGVSGVLLRMKKVKMKKSISLLWGFFLLGVGGVFGTGAVPSQPEQVHEGEFSQQEGQDRITGETPGTEQTTYG